MSINLNTTSFQYKESGTITWQPLTVQASAEFASTEILSKIAHVFSSSNTYSIGEYVLYNEKFYRCIIAVTTAGDWDATNWLEIKLSDEIETINSTKTTLDAVYPVGSVYISTSSTSPASMFGGTWTRIKDKFLLSAGDTYTAGATGGSASHKHGTQGHTLTTTEIPSHHHNANANILSYKSGSSSFIIGKDTSGSTADYCQNVSGGRASSNTGGGGSHSHGDTIETTTLPPYLAVYVWERIT